MTSGESSRSATVKAEETPSKLLRQLSRALAQPELDQQLTPLRQKVGTPRRRASTTPRTPRTRRTSIIHLTPSTTRLSLKKQNKDKDDKLKPKKETPQELLRALSRAPGFVKKPQVIMDAYNDQSAENIEFTREFKKEVNDVTDVYSDQDTETIEFTKEFNPDMNDDIIDVCNDSPKHKEFTRQFKLNLHEVNDDITDVYSDQDTETIEFTKGINDINEDIIDVCNDQVAETVEFTEEVKLNPQDINVDDITDVYNQATESIEFTGEDKMNIDDIDVYNDINVYDENIESTEETNIDSPKHKEPKPKGPPQLPKSLIKKVFNSFSNAKLSKAAMQVVVEGSQLFFEQIATDLATYAAHGKREIIQDKDVLLLMKRQGLINDNISFEYLAERYLPRELMNDVCVVARAGNRLG